MQFSRTDFYVLLGILTFITLMWSFDLTRYKPPTVIPCDAQIELAKCRGRLARMIERERVAIMADNPRMIEPDKVKVKI